MAMRWKECGTRQVCRESGEANDYRGTRSAFVLTLNLSFFLLHIVMQLHMTFGDSLVGPNSTNELYHHATRFAPIGVIHDWYPLGPQHPLPNYYNDLQRLNLANSRLPIPFMQLGECLHGVGSNKQSMFPSPIGLAASWDRELVKRVGRAVGRETRALGIHACFAPVLDLGKDPRWGRTSGSSNYPSFRLSFIFSVEAWGEDYVLTTHMGVAYTQGLSKDGQWHEPDAVVPVVKVFAVSYLLRSIRLHLIEAFRWSWFPSWWPQYCSVFWRWSPGTYDGILSSFQGCFPARWSKRSHDVTTYPLNSHDSLTCYTGPITNTTLFRRMSTLCSMICSTNGALTASSLLMMEVGGVLALVA